MGRLEIVLILIGVSACLIHVVSGIKCIVCNSEYQKDCAGGSIAELQKYSVDCEALDASNKSVYLTKLFGSYLVVDTKRILLSPFIRWDNGNPVNSSNSTTSAPVKVNGTNSTQSNATGMPEAPTSMIDPESWIGGGWKGSTPPEENYEYHPLDYSDDHQKHMLDETRTTLREQPFQYNACRKLVLETGDTTIVYVQEGQTRTKVKDSLKGKSLRVVRLCGNVQPEGKIKQDKGDKDLLNKKCKAFKGKTTTSTDCICNKDACNGSPKGLHLLSIRVIVAISSLPVLIIHLINK